MRMRYITWSVGVIMTAGMSFGDYSKTPKLIEGFVVTQSLINTDEIVSGGVGQDGIPALTDPEVILARDAVKLNRMDKVIGVEMNGDSRAYPIKLLNWHEVINDKLGAEPIVVTWCPLCWSGLVFSRTVEGEVLEFGVSGLLWNSNALLYDRQSWPGRSSLWSQVQMRAVTGPASNGDPTGGRREFQQQAEEIQESQKKIEQVGPILPGATATIKEPDHQPDGGLLLKLLPSELTTWGMWLDEHPATTVVSFKTNHRRNYQVDPYRIYLNNNRLMYPVIEATKRPASIRTKEPMAIIRLNGSYKAYALRDLSRAARAIRKENPVAKEDEDERVIIPDTIGGEKVNLAFSLESKSVRATLAGPDNRKLSVASVFWFAVGAMLPEAEVYQFVEEASEEVEKEKVIVEVEVIVEEKVEEKK